MLKGGEERLHSLLFEEGRELLNIKFLPGVNRGLTPAEMSSEADGVIRSARAKGPVDQPPMSGIEKTHV